MAGGVSVEMGWDVSHLSSDRSIRMAWDGMEERCGDVIANGEV